MNDRSLFYLLLFSITFTAFLPFDRTFIKNCAVVREDRIEPVAYIIPNARVRAIFLWYLLWLVISRRCSSRVITHGRSIPKENLPLRLTGENDSFKFRDVTYIRIPVIFFYQKSFRSSRDWRETFSFFYYVQHIRVRFYVIIYVCRSLSCNISFIRIIYIHIYSVFIKIVQNSCG